jgi:selenocysteine lyase/cysteine desulfurase
MTRHLKERLSQVEGLTLFGPGADVATAPIVSLAVDGMASADVARILDREFHIAVRAGLHCAPEAHKVAGTLEAGLVRLSVGHATTWAEIDASIETLTDIASKPKEHWLKTWEKMNVR